MFVNNEITERGLLHRALEHAAHEVTLDERRSWAQSIDGAIRDAASGSAPLRARVARPGVVLAAAPALVAVAAVLRDEDAVVDEDALGAVRTFMTDGVESPLYGPDALIARRAAEALRTRFAGAQRAPGEPVAGAA
jgi:hypothetical protein